MGAILEIALKGVRRSAVFMGLGVNAARNPENCNYQLSGITQIQLVPDNVPEETVAHFKEEFQIWIVAGALREATEAFALFLDELHRACGIILALKNNTSLEDVAEKQSKYAREGLPNKFNILDQRFGVKSAFKEYLLLVNQARNCLTHRRGIVGPEDVKDQSQFTLKWRGLDIFAEEPDGNKIDLTEIPEGGVLLENGGQVKAQVVERSRSFEKGALLSLSPRDLAEVCWFLTEAAKEITRTTIEFAQANGATVEE
ncbi:hypothetical protein [Phaeobacter sp.]|uniref:hypothetical protein n=1 Tax=Phaeobacter sp. TaxID=1902409 RepID=UPI0025FB91DB|nr:hypothetical protein [Phaeobacter sp.]